MHEATRVLDGLDFLFAPSSDAASTLVQALLEARSSCFPGRATSFMKSERKWSMRLWPAIHGETEREILQTDSEKRCMKKKISRVVVTRPPSVQSRLCVHWKEKHAFARESSLPPSSSIASLAVVDASGSRLSSASLQQSLSCSRHVSLVRSLCSALLPLRPTQDHSRDAVS